MKRNGCANQLAKSTKQNTKETLDSTSLIPTKNELDISCAEEDGAVGGTLEHTPNVAMSTAISAGILNKISCKNGKQM